MLFLFSILVAGFISGFYLAEQEAIRATGWTRVSFAAIVLGMNFGMVAFTALMCSVPAN